MMETKICGITFKNPVIMASGTFGFGEEYNQFYDINLLGGISTKGLTLEKREGNDGLRIFETSSGILNSVGLQNPGVDGFIEYYLPRLNDLKTVVIANIGGSQVEDYLESVSRLSETPLPMIELNISCPNVKHGGMAFGIKADVAKEFVKEVRKVCKKPLMVKLSPNAEDICQMAYAMEEAGADAISLVNTLKGMAIDIKARKPVFNNVSAGLSGPAIKPIALRMVYEVCKTVSIPVVGMGGISTSEDAIEFIMAGATAIQVGTASFANPTAGIEVVEGIRRFLTENKVSLNEIRGIV